MRLRPRQPEILHIPATPVEINTLQPPGQTLLLEAQKYNTNLRMWNVLEESEQRKETCKRREEADEGGGGNAGFEAAGIPLQLEPDGQTDRQTERGR